MTYEEVKQRIKSSVKTGDVARIVKRANQQSTQPYYQALKKNAWEELTRGQEEVIIAALEYLNERDAFISKVQNNVLQ